jgi:putative membrane protein
MMHWDGHGGSGWVVGMAIMMILFWGSITALIWVGVRALLGHPQLPSSTDRQEPRVILAERLARGEIEPEEFQRRLELLGGPR